MKKADIIKAAKQKQQTNCPNCGAPITGLRCEYCGTQFFNIADLKLFEPGYLRMQYRDEISTFRAIPTEVEVHRNEDEEIYYSDNSPVFLVRPSQGMTVKITLNVIKDDNGNFWVSKKNKWS